MDTIRITLIKKVLYTQTVEIRKVKDDDLSDKLERAMEAANLEGWQPDGDNEYYIEEEDSE
jgi:hypothetical protein